MSRPSAVVLTLSDSVASGRREDLSGPAVKAELKKKFQVIKVEVVADDYASIEAALRRLAGEADLVVTTGSTPRAGPRGRRGGRGAVCWRLRAGGAHRLRALSARRPAIGAAWLA